MSASDPSARGPRAGIQPLWAEVESYITTHLIEPEDSGERILEASREAGLGFGAVSAVEGKLLEVLARARGARRILELGTHGGYSTAWLARALPADGLLVTLELEAGNARVARANLDRAGLGDLVEIRVGPALGTLDALREEGAEPFDLVFMDADKQGYPDYLDRCLELSAPGTLIVADNVVRAGLILEEDAVDPRLGEGGIQALRAFYERLAAVSGRVSATAVQTVGAKGHDGLVLAVLRQTATPSAAGTSPGESTI